MASPESACCACCCCFPVRPDPTEICRTALLHLHLCCSCTLRWWLSRWNYKLAGGWAWFPAGTFAANMLGTALDFGLEVRAL